MFLQKNSVVFIEHAAGYLEAQVPGLALCNRLWADHFSESVSWRSEEFVPAVQMEVQGYAKRQ